MRKCPKNSIRNWQNLSKTFDWVGWWKLSLSPKRNVWQWRAQPDTSSAILLRDPIIVFVFFGGEILSRACIYEGCWLLSRAWGGENHIQLLQVIASYCWLLKKWFNYPQNWQKQPNHVFFVLNFHFQKFRKCANRGNGYCCHISGNHFCASWPGTQYPESGIAKWKTFPCTVGILQNCGESGVRNPPGSAHHQTRPQLNQNLPLIANCPLLLRLRF